ncbi:MAG: Gldg family protein [Planctomycetota bacterium]|jgi:ABC-type uncharacterized transport system involved in gliding motility auxiliary subunit
MNSRNTTVGLLLAAALFLALNLLTGPLLRGVRADLTEQRLYTLSDGTRNILRGLEEPITLRFFFAKSVASDAPPILSYGERVREMLEEYVAIAGGMLDLEVIEPEPYSEAEELAVGYGIQGRIANQEGDRLYMGIVGTNSVDDEEVLPVLDPRRESFLEYELTEMIDRLENPELPVVGLVSSLPLRGGSQPATQPGQPPQQLPPWPILDLVERRYEVRDLAPASLTEIDDEIDLLLLVHPKGLTPAGSYAIDQFALRGGKVVAFVDPFCFFDPARQSNDPMAALNNTSDSGIDQLLLAWGVALQPGRVVGDAIGGLAVRNQANEPVKMPLAFGVTDETIDGDDILTSPLTKLRFFLPGALSRADDAPEGVRVETLVTTTADGGGTVDTITLMGPLDPQVVADSFLPNAPEAAVAVRVSGDVRTAFPDGPPGAAEEPTEEGEAPAEEGDHLATSSAPFNALVFADADMLQDSVWATPMRDIFGNVRLQPQVDNASLLVSALENLSGSSDLISLRSRAEFSRPFTRKEELMMAAEERFRAEELELEAKLADTQARLDELQRDKDPSSALILSPEQEEQIQSFRAEQVETRRKLREVKRELRAEIDALGTRLKLLNIFLVPAIIAALVLSVRMGRAGARSGGATS